MQARTHSGEAARKADFSRIRYAQCWEDADILLAGLDIQPGDTCLSIASAGDNAIALLLGDPAKVIALDMNLSQLHCLELRVAAYRILSHPELLELIGSRPSADRIALYRRCRSELGPSARAFWDASEPLIAKGIGAAGKFERYFQLFRAWALPFAHSQRRVRQLLAEKPAPDRRTFYDQKWDTWRWRLLFRVFFSRFVMGRLGRDPSFFDYVDGSVGDRILNRARHALRELDPSANPYLHWILQGTHGEALPLALRAEHFETIRERIGRLEWRLCSLEDYCHADDRTAIDRFNLSDIFEYMSEANSERLLRSLLALAKPGGRFAYWNMLAPRSRPESLSGALACQDALAQQLFRQDKAFFYSRFVIEEVL